MTISSWLNFSRPVPPWRGLWQGEDFWLHLTTASVQCLRLLRALFHYRSIHKCRLLGKLFSNAASSKRYLFSVSISAFVCFYSTADRMWSTFWYRLETCFTHTVNANEFCTKALPGSRWFRLMYHMWSRQQTEFVANKFTHSLTNTELHISVQKS